MPKNPSKGATPTPPKKRGPEPERVKIKGDWKAAIKRALNKPTKTKRT